MSDEDYCPVDVFKKKIYIYINVPLLSSTLVLFNALPFYLMKQNGALSGFIIHAVHRAAVQLCEHRRALCAWLCSPQLAGWEFSMHWGECMICCT